MQQLWMIPILSKKPKGASYDSDSWGSLIINNEGPSF